MLAHLHSWQDKEIQGAHHLPQALNVCKGSAEQNVTHAIKMNQTDPDGVKPDKIKSDKVRRGCILLSFCRTSLMIALHIQS